MDRLKRDGSGWEGENVQVGIGPRVSPECALRDGMAGGSWPIWGEDRLSP